MVNRFADIAAHYAVYGTCLVIRVHLNDFHDAHIKRRMFVGRRLGHHAWHVCQGIFVGHMRKHALAQAPQAMQLRYLQTLTQVANERTSTIVFPVPSEILRALDPRPK